MTGLPEFTVPLSEAMIKTVALGNVYLSTEPDVCVVGSPLARGYSLFIAGKEKEGRAVIEDFLVRVFPSRRGEMSTRQFVNQICAEKGLPRPIANERVAPEILREAAGRRFDRLHLPLLRSILARGYRPELSHPVTMRQSGNRFLVVDGKNRCSILAALGEEVVSNVRLL